MEKWEDRVKWTKWAKSPKGKEWFNRNRKERWANGKDRNTWYKRAYGITLVQYNQILKIQNGTCALCQRLEIPGKYRRNLAVDHDHKTKVVRGLLCYYCNRFRVAKNTLDTAKRLVNYLSQNFDGRNV